MSVAVLTVMCSLPVNTLTSVLTVEILKLRSFRMNAQRYSSCVLLVLDVVAVRYALS